VSRTPGPHGRWYGDPTRGSGSSAGDSGQSSVEFGLVLPLMVTVMLAVVQIGAVARDQLLVWHAARESARAAAVDPSLPAARLAGVNASSGLVPDRLSVSLGGGGATGDLVTAVVVYRSPTEVPLVGRLLGDIELRAEVTMRVE